MYRMLRTGIVLLAELGFCVLVLYGPQSNNMPHENRFQELLRMECEAKTRYSLEHLRSRSLEIGAKVVRRHRELEHLSFRDESRLYWCKSGSFAATLPMNWWRYRRPLSIARVFNSGDNVRLEISSQGQPVLTFLRCNGRIAEYRWAIGTEPGAETSYDESGYVKDYRLGANIDFGIRCQNGLYLVTNIGPNSLRPERFKRFFDHGIWVGTTQVDGVTCDVLLCRFESDEEREFNAFYIEPGGLVLVWIQTGVIDDPNADVVLKIKHYTDYKTDPIPPEVFEPDAALLEAAKGWRKLSDAESLAEWKAARGK